jgi:hypothetical protein
MSKAQAIVGENVVGSDSVRVIRVCATLEDARKAQRGWSYANAMPIWYRAGKSEPREGDVLGTWLDGSTRYAMA